MISKHYSYQDLKKELKLNSGYKRKLAILAYRFKFYFYHVHRSRFMLILAKFFSRIVSYICLYEIPVESVYFGPGLCIPHGFYGCFFAPQTKAGSNLTIYHNVTIGVSSPESSEVEIHIGNNVTIGCGSTIIGNTYIGDQVSISAGSTLFNPSIEAHTKVRK